MGYLKFRVNNGYKLNECGEMFVWFAVCCIDYDKFKNNAVISVWWLYLWCKSLVVGTVGFLKL